MQKGMQELGSFRRRTQQPWPLLTGHQTKVLQLGSAKLHMEDYPLGPAAQPTRCPISLGAGKVQLLLDR